MAKSLTQERKMRVVAREEAVRVLYEFVDDPDFGLELTGAAKRRLSRAMKDRRPGISFSEIKRRYL